MRNILLLGIAGFMGALLVDLDAWSKYPSDSQRAPFDWGTAAKRWAVGFITGCVTGLTTVTQPD